MTSFSLDRVNNADAKAVAEAAVSYLDRAQDFPPEVRILSIATIFLAFCRKYRVDPAEMFRAIVNLLATRHRDNPNFRTLNLYVEHEA